MASAELKKRLIAAIDKVENPAILKALYDRLLSTPQEGYILNKEDISAIGEAKEQYGAGDNFSREKAGREIEDDYISGLVASGEYQNYKEIITEALGLHKRAREKEIEVLRKEIDLGWDGPDSSMTMEEIIESHRKS